MDYKAIYEAFKAHPRLDEQDKEMIVLSERILSSKYDGAESLVYSKLWLNGWINTLNYRLFLEDLIGNKSRFNVQIA